MKKEVIERFVGKEIAFKKNGSDTTFVGKILELTSDTMILEFRGRLQAHLIESIIEIEEAFKDGD